MGLDSFEELLPALLDAFSEMKENEERKSNKETCTKAAYLLKAIDFEFLANLVITRSIFDLSLNVTELLQSKNNDIADGVNQIRSLIKLVDRSRDKHYIQAFHDECYAKVLELAKTLKIKETMPRLCGRQTNRSNHPQFRLF